MRRRQHRRRERIGSPSKSHVQTELLGGGQGVLGGACLVVHGACGILAPRPATEPVPLAMEVQSLNHCTLHHQGIPQTLNNFLTYKWKVWRSPCRVKLFYITHAPINSIHCLGLNSPPLHAPLHSRWFFWLSLFIALKRHGWSTSCTKPHSSLSVYSSRAIHDTLHSQKDNDLCRKRAHEEYLQIQLHLNCPRIGFLWGIAFLLPTKEVTVLWRN